MERSTGLREYGQPAPDHTPDAEHLAGLYAFGILEGAELARFEAHLAACGRCAEVVDGDRAVVSTLGLTVPEVEAAPDLKRRLLERAAAESAPGEQRAFPDGPVAKPSRRRASAAPLTWLLPLAAILLALLGGAYLLSRELATAQVVAEAPLENRLERGSAEVLIRKSGEGVVRLSGFDDLADGRVYQAWVIGPGLEPRPTGAGTNGNGTLTLDGDIRGTTVAVTLEAGPGAQAPSRPPFLVGRIPAPA